MTEDCSPSDSETDQEPLLQQEPAGSHYPVQNRHPPNILCYDRLGNPSYHPISTLSTSATNANVSVYLPSLPVTTYRTLAIHNYWMIPFYTAVYLACTICGPKLSPVRASDDCLGKLQDCLS